MQDTLRMVADFVHVVSIVGQGSAAVQEFHVHVRVTRILLRVQVSQLTLNARSSVRMVKSSGGGDVSGVTGARQCDGVLS